MKIEIGVLEVSMRKRIIDFLNRHRLILILVILIFIVIIFLAAKTILFFSHNFQALSCTEEIDDEYCYYEDTIIFVDPNASKEAFFARYDEEVAALEEEYSLPEFNYYTAYYYLVAARLNYSTKEEYKIFQNFFEVYANTYNIEEFYLQNSFYFNLFYPYKIV